MKIVLIKSNLREGLAAVERASGGTNLPILKNVLIEAREGKIRLSATDLELAITCNAPGKILEEGRLTVPLDVLLSLISNLPSERLDLEAKGNNLDIKTDNYEGRLLGASAEDFPLIPKVQDQSHYLELKADVLNEALTQVTAATQMLDLRPELSSVLIDFTLDTLKFVATDSFRLAEKTLAKNQFQTTHTEPFRLLIPLRTVQEMLRLIKNEESVRLYHDASQLFCTANGIEMISRLLEATFPEYGSVVPSEFSSEAVIDRQEFMNAVKLAAVLGSKTSEVRIKVSKDSKAVEVSSSDQAMGENKYLLPAKITGQQEEVGFNWRYLMDGLRALRSEEVFIGFYQENKKALIKDIHNTSYFYILASLSPV